MPFNQVDLTKLPAPNVIEPLDFESILAAIKADLLARDITLTAVALESSVEALILEVCAYRELLLRQRLNDDAKALLLAYATAADLDNLGANYGVVRLIIVPENLTTIPPTVAIMEADNALRERIRLSLYSRTTAGPANQYIYFARSADADVLDVSVISPVPGDVLLTVLSRTGSGGAPTQTVLDKVYTICNADDVRPLTDHLIVQAANIINYTVSAKLTIYPKVDRAMILNASLLQMQTYCDTHHALAHDITRTGLIAAATVAGVQNVSLSSPVADLVIDDISASYATAINAMVAGVAI